MQETQILSDFNKMLNKMLLKHVEQLEVEEPTVNVKWLAFFCKKMPLQFPTILDAYFDAMVLDYLGSFCKVMP